MTTNPKKSESQNKWIQLALNHSDTMTMTPKSNTPQNPGLLPPKPPSTKNFSDLELRCTCCGENKMNESFLVRLQEIRDIFGVPMMLSSAYRCPEWNERQSNTKSRTGPHTTGRAVDVSVSHQDALRLIRIALERGITGIGVKQNGTGRFIHIDDLTDGIRPHIWSY